MKNHKWLSPIKCDDPECLAEHHVYFDEESGVVIAEVAGREGGLWSIRVGTSGPLCRLISLEKAKQKVESFTVISGNVNLPGMEHHA